MSAKTDTLNRTWTLLPEDENVDENEQMDTDCPMDFDDHMQDDQIFHVENHSNLLDEEEMCIDLTCQSMAKNQTRIISDGNSYLLNETRQINNKTVNMNETVNKSPIALKESLFVNYIYDIEKISIQIENSINRFKFDENDNNYESLWDETFTGLDCFDGAPISNPCSPKQSATNINNLTINLETEKITTSKPIPKLQKQISLSSSLSASIDNLDNLQFNPSSIPKSFDLFINDLKKSSSTFTLNSLHSNSQTNLASGLNRRIITSSIDKDLHKDFKISTNKINNLSNLKENDSDLVTSSPLKNKIKLNTTIDLNTRNANSNESLNESASLSVSQSSSIANFNMNNDDDPRTVFNSTYTAWATTDQQLQLEAFNQHKRIVQSNSSILLNQTQDMNNNTSRDDLNKTKDIIHDSNENLNRTRDLKQPSKVLNTTQDLSEPSSQFVKPIQTTQNLKRVSSIQTTQRPSSIYQKSKLAMNPPKPVQIKTEIKKAPVVGKQIAPPVNTQSLDLTKPKIVSKIPAKSPIKSPSQIQRPNTLATQNGNLLKPNSSSQVVNLNRLSSTSSSSSTSTSSSSSLKENKKSPTSQIKSPTTTSKIATLNSLNHNSGLSRLKPPSVAAIPKPTVIPQPTSLANNKIQNEQIQAPKSMLKLPSQIPSFKAPTGIPMFRNTTNQVKK
ncbi:unnamed protein product [Brachionus calyciflorus]|uniref:Uncharacterized protein n=1 Tax=Brachionus calyciflorus TaxID=104777 RepID=A0A813Q044_9BILA|nr:unnamed protein product [Brachionus calyciflorus]